ncbi:MAG: hypothetical protein IMF19_04675 [Proteobacteria bacterium]|nr:hypothetical protein [Pseudomonadota bacterium]
MRSYRERRALELAENIKKKKRKSGPTLTQEEKDLMKSLGIKQRDLALLKEIL